MTAIKICCIGSVLEAEVAIAAGAEALGLVADMPSGPGPISDTLIAEITASIAGRAESFLLTQRTEADAIIAHVTACHPSVVQLVKETSADTRATVKAALPHIELVQVVHVASADTIPQAHALAEHADALLLDSGRPDAATPELGGTGRTHDWEISRRIVDSVDLPVWLAGGLNVGNVREAISVVQPHGVDLCTGVRTSGALDLEKLAGYIAVVRAI